MSTVSVALQVLHVLNTGSQPFSHQKRPYFPDRSKGLGQQPCMVLCCGYICSVSLSYTRDGDSFADTRSQSSAQSRRTKVSARNIWLDVCLGSGDRFTEDVDQSSMSI